MELICELPEEWSFDRAATDGEHAYSAARHLMRCLGQRRGIRYELVDRPDRVNRREKAADFRFRCIETNTVVAVEHKRFVKPEDQEAKSHLSRGKVFGVKGGVRPMELHGEQVGAIWADDVKSELNALRRFVVEAVDYGQLQATEAHERILLVEDGRYIPRDGLEREDFQIQAHERKGVDGGFLLSPGANDEKTLVFVIWRAP